MHFKQPLKGADNLYLATATHEGREAWYYILVERPKLPLFLKAMRSDFIEFDKYGKILYSGYGSEPPAHTTDELLNGASNGQDS